MANSGASGLDDESQYNLPNGIRDTCDGRDHYLASDEDYKMRWYAHLKFLSKHDPRIFSRHELRSECEEGSDVLYFRGIGVSINTCLGLRRVHEVYYKPRQRNPARGNAEFEHLQTTISQLFRMAICTSMCSKEAVWEGHTLFTCVANLELVERFIDVFFLRGSPSTTKTKATCLKRVCDVGVVFGKDDYVRNRLNLVSVFLQNVANAARRAHRALCQRKKLSTHGCVPRRMIPPSQYCMNVFKRRASTVLDFTMRSYWASRHNKLYHITKPIVYLKLKLWSINFLALFMLMSGGQRPQVFSQLQVPNKREFRRFYAQRGRISHIELRTIHEKRSRHLDLPNLVLPAAILPYLKFHVEVIRPAILESTRGIRNGFCEPLILHTKTGTGLKPLQVTTVLQNFLCSHSAGLRGTTSMDLRRSYANMILRSYHQGQVFRELSEAEFLQKIAQQMNTSAEQLRRTYMSLPGCSLYPETATLVKFWGAFLRS